MHASTPATRVLLKAGVPFTLRTYAHDPATRAFGDEAVAELGVEAERVYKTLVIAIDSGLAVAVLPVPLTLDLKACASFFGSKRAVLADPAVVERRTGYVVGGVSPLGGRSALPTVIDERALSWETILVSGGRRGLDIELDPRGLARVIDARFSAVARASSSGGDSATRAR